MTTCCLDPPPLRSNPIVRLKAQRPSSASSSLPPGQRRKRFSRFVLRARKKQPSWWQKLFSEEGWPEWSAEDVLGDEEEEQEEETASEEEKFEAWKRKAEAISELREAQEDARNAEGRAWEDWLGDDAGHSSWDQDWADGVGTPSDEVSDSKDGIFMREKGIVKAIKDLVVGKDEDDDNNDLLFEDRVFRYASTSSAKFIVLLILVPWALSFLVHDYVLMPFLDRYVKTVPLAAEFFDIRRQQKLEIVKTLRLEKARFHLEVEIGKSPPLSDEELWLELRQKALELRDEARLKNRSAFANILSDMVYGIALFLLIYLNKSKVALLKFTGYKLINNLSDSGKAFFIILVTDLFLGFHSEAGWQVMIEIILEHYGLEIDQAAITIFICTVPVVIDACVKLWLFKFLPKLSPNVANIFENMQRH